ncbi:urease accessory protein UreE [Pseudomonas sp. BIGb0427]|uniref:urease accessory protein UreE n=1 Tax=unclassified Pseudomonas TaxID=196821 RepID=UPI0016A90D9F|nr:MULTISPECIES: urease accessory protein UreE [unclassified Pseudomonas]NLU60247.1 urease accessory protein UreE [Pseudomonas sp. BIGb0427]QPG61672.1 urease accessory protein UreE [Pseudomonas sp. BIGb0427]UVL63961.1 urease accessory protein UreE [Pseudomonas sp. B21-032]UVM69185.1 urease accessory protein UreE [Pseudomonas sp. B21-009]
MILLTRRLSDAATVSGTVTLTVDTRIKSRVRVTLDDGREAGLMLERGQLLRGGELLGQAQGGEVIRVLAAAEQVSSVRCADPLLLTRAAYHLGNRHVPLQIEAGLLRYQHDHVLDEMVRGLGLDVTVEQAPFEPEAGAYQSAPHSHAHSDHLFVRVAHH